MANREDRIEQVAILVALAVVAIGALLVLRPFLTALLWALILTISTWPTFRWLTDSFGGRKTLAAAIMTLLVVLALVVPLAVVGATLAENVTVLAARTSVLIKDGIPPPPDWLATLPFVGERAFVLWMEHAIDPVLIADKVVPYFGPATNWLLGRGARLGGGLLELTLSIIVAFFLYRDGAAAAQRLQTVVQRLAGHRTQRLLAVAQGTLKGVVYGLIGTALVQGVLAGLGYWIAGIPAAFFWGLVTFFLSIFPIGAPLVWVPATAWLFFTGETGWAIFLGLWGLLVVSSVDNFLKPILIGRASALPILLVLLGVLGGALAFGFLGIFIGPTLLALAFTLIREWGPGEAIEAVTERPPAA